MPKGASGALSRLLAEKNRFTIETQGLSYPTKQQLLAVREDAAWTDDESSDGEDGRRSRSPPVAQKVASELSRLLQGGAGGLNEAVLESALVESLGTDPTAAGYDVAKDYLKQVLGQLYGGEPLNQPTHAPAPAGAEPDKLVSAPKPPVPHPPYAGPDLYGYGHAQQNAPTATSSAAAAPPQHPATASAATAARGQLAAHGSGAAAAAAAAAASTRADSHPEEQPRVLPRPHHGRIKEQLDLLQNADQLAAIISVATTAATTAAAAAVKQSMQTPTPPLPPGAYARMLAAARSGGPGIVPGGWASSQEGDMGLPPSLRLAMGMMGMPAAGEGGAAGQGRSGGEAAVNGGAGEGDSPDPQPQPRTAPAPHQRATPMQRQGADSSMRVVQLGAPKVTARTPPPGSRPVPPALSAARADGVDSEAVGPGAEDGPARNISFGGWAKDEAGEHPDVRNERDAGGGSRSAAPGAPRGRGLHYVSTHAAGAAEAAQASAVQLQRAARALAAAGDKAAAAAASGARVAGEADSPQGPSAQGLREGHLQDGQQFDRGTTAQLAEELPAEGLFVAGGSSVFGAHAGAGALVAGVRKDTGAAAAAQPRPQLPSRPRPELPPDVAAAFRNTLAFIADPDTALQHTVQQQPRQPPAWLALADVEAREQAKKEAQELLGGAFDYAAAKRELERAKRYSRLMARTHAQAHVSPIPATHAAAAGAAAGVPPGRAGVGAPGAGGAAAKGGAAGRGQRPGGVPVRGAGATAGAAGPGVGAAPAVARGDFAGVLPPPHTVWDVDEAWHDLDEFTRVVGQEVAYRAAAPAVTAGAAKGAPGLRAGGSPGRGAGTAAAGGAAATGGGTTAAVRSGKPAAEQAAASATVAASGPSKPKGRPSSPSRGRTGSPGRARSPSASPASPPRVAGLAIAASAAAAATVRARQAAAGPVRVAFGRRVEEPPKKTSKPAGRRRSSSSSPPRPGRSSSPQRRRRAAAGAAADRLSTGSVGTDTMRDMLEVLASVLLSEGGSEQGEDVGGPQDEAPATRPAVQGQPAMEAESDMAARTGPAALRQARDVTTAGAGLEEGGQTEHAEPKGQAAATDAATAAVGSGQAVVEAAAGAAGSGPGAATAPAPRPALLTAAGPPGAAPWAAGDPAAAAATLHSSLRQATQATGSPRRQFTYVMDTGHPPLPRLPTWAASARATGAAAAYAAAVSQATGTATAAGVAGTPTRPQQPGVGPYGAAATLTQRLAAAAADAAVAAQGYASPGRGPVSGLAAAATNILPADAQQQHLAMQQLALQQQQQQLPLLAGRAQYMQLTAFPVPSDPLTATHVLAPDGAAAAVAAAAAAAAARTAAPASTRKGKRGKGAGGPGGEAAPEGPAATVETALMQLVEDEVVGRLATAQLAAQRVPPAVVPQEQPGSLPPLVDYELAHSLVTAVLRDNLKLLLKQQQGQVQAQHQAGYGPAYGNTVYGNVHGFEPTAAEAQPPLTLEEVVAALAAQPVVLPVRQPAQQHQQPGLEQGAEQAGLEVVAAEFTSRQPAGHHGDDQGQGAAARDAAADGNEAAASSVEATQPLSTGMSEGLQAADGTEQLQQEQKAHAEGSLGAASAGSGPESGSSSGSSVQGQAQGPMPPAATQRREPSAADLVSGQSGWGGVLNQALQGAASGLGRALRAGAAKAVEVATRIDPTGMHTDQEQPPPPPQQQQQSTQVLDYARQQQQQQQVHSGRELSVQAAGVQARGTDAFGVQTRGVQAAGVAVVGTQAVGSMERGTQAAGVRDTAAQADPPPPHYLLQAAMAAGMSAYGLAPAALPAAPAAPATAPGVPYFLVPADGSAAAPAAYLPSYAASGLYGGLGLAGGREGRKALLNLPGLYKMRDSSELDTSTDSLHPPRRIKGPGARAREARAALGSYGSDDDDNDSDLLQRSYPRLELSSLTARPVRLMDRAALEQEEQEDARNPLERLPFDRLGLGPPVPSVPGGVVSRDGSGRAGQQGHRLWEQTQEEVVTELVEVAHGSVGSDGSAAGSRRTVGVQGEGSDGAGRELVQPPLAEAASGPGPGWGAGSAAGSARSGVSGASCASGASAPFGSLPSVHSGSGSHGALMLVAGPGGPQGRHPDEELEELLSLPSGGSGLGSDRVPMQAAPSRAGSSVAAGTASGRGSAAGGSAAASVAGSQAYGGGPGSAADGGSDVAGQSSRRASGSAASDRGSQGGSIVGATTPGADVRRDKVGSGEGTVGQAVPWTPLTPPAVADDQLVEEDGAEEGGAVDEVEEVEFEDEDGLGLLQAAEYSDDLASEEPGGEEQQQQQGEAGRGEALEGQAAGPKSATQEGLQHAGRGEQPQAAAGVGDEGTGGPGSAGSSARGSGGGSAGSGGLGGTEARSVRSADGDGSAGSAPSAVENGGVVQGEGQGEQEMGSASVEAVRRYGSGGDEEDEHGGELEGNMEGEVGDEVEVEVEVEVEEEQLLDEEEVGRLLDKEDEVAEHAEDEGLDAVVGGDEEPQERGSAAEVGSVGSRGDGGALVSLGGSSRGSGGQRGDVPPAADSAEGGGISSSGSSSCSSSSSNSSSGGSGKGRGSAAGSGAPSRAGSVEGPGSGVLPRPAPEPVDAADPEDGVVEPVHAESSMILDGEDVGANPPGAWGRHDHEDGVGEDQLRSSLERMATVGLAALELPRRSGQGSLRGAAAAVVTTTAPPAAAAAMAAGRTLTGGAVLAGPEDRQAAAPLTHMRTVSFGGVTTREAAPLTEAPEAPPSPGQPPRLDTYRGPAGRLWRPPGPRDRDPHDPLLSSSSETLMADSEASEPPLDPLSATLRMREQRQDMLRAQAVDERVLPYGGLLAPMQTYTDVRTRRTERPMGRAPAYAGVDSPRDSDGRVLDVDLDVSSSSDSSTVGPSGTASASSARAAAALAAARAGGVAAGRGRGARAGVGLASRGQDTDDEDEEDEDRVERGPWGAGGGSRAAQASTAAAAGAAGGRREAAVFRLRQYSMRRRKLMQQIGVRDPLLSSATSLSTDTSSRPGDTERDLTYTLDGGASDRELGLGDDDEDDDGDDGGSSVMAGDVFPSPPVPMAPLPSFGVGAGRLGSRLARPL